VNIGREVPAGLPGRKKYRTGQETRNSSGDEIKNVNFFYDDIVHVEACAYAH